MNVNLSVTYNTMEICQTCLRTGVYIHPMSVEDLKSYRLFIPKVEDPLVIMYICIYCKSFLRRIVKFIEQCRLSDAIIKEALSKGPEILPKVGCDRLGTSKTTYNYVGTRNDVDFKEEGDLKNETKDDEIPLLNANNGDEDCDDYYDEELFSFQVPEGSPKVRIDRLGTSVITYYYVGPDSDTDLKLEDNLKNEDDDDDDIPLIFLNPSNGDDCNDRYDDEELDKSNMKMEVKIEGFEDIAQTDRPNGKTKKPKKKHVKEGFTTRMVTETNEYVVIKLTKEQIMEEMKQNSNSEKYKILPYKCEKCVKGFNFEDVLQSHMEKHSPSNGPFQCELCEQYCPSKVSLRGHMKSHSTRYKCKLCDLVRLSRQHILEHYSLEHTDSAALYRCPNCPHTTNKRTVMQRHVRLHSTNEPLKCKLCGKLYKSKESLRVHVMRHDSKKLHQCDVCTSSFVYATQLTKHMRSVHERMDYYCVECDVMFKSMDNLKQHLQRAKRHRDSSSYNVSMSCVCTCVHTQGSARTHAPAAPPSRRPLPSERTPLPSIRNENGRVLARNEL
ncbi:zinc finger protein 236-like isoform X2 [Nymphalis io]|uniref:zinc finger protein 236-like isoform X2 n=1 Tax=Inachis io TaxID=171585 RepID=UPI002167F860|nr:zinc finger protein 236-like isoform X2 [Nymphalis io]